MATVKLHDDLRRQIIASATAGLNKQMMSLHQEVQTLFNLEELYALVVPRELQAKLQELPREYLNTRSSLDVRLAGSTEMSPCSWSIYLSTSRPWPSGVSYAVVGHDSALPGYTRAAELMRRHYKLFQEEQTLRTSLNKLLGSCNTLGQVIEVWPTVLDHVPAAIRTKHHEKVKRKVAKAEAIDPAVKATLVKSTMLSAPK